MSYRWVEHTGELELEVRAPTEEAVFAEALQALAELLVEEDPSRPDDPVRLDISLSGRDRALLLADWLDELVFRAETEGVVPAAIERLALNGGGLSATVGAARGTVRPLVKGITHHRLMFEGRGGVFIATVVLDV